ncbi:MAG: DUF192 domain-containing protein [Aquihabitans sp.]
MPWLLRDGEVLSSLVVASTRSDRRRGLLGTDGLDGALLIERARSVHSIGMRFPIDVAFCDADFKVLKTLRLEPRRITMPVLRAHEVIEAEAGRFAHWGLTVGDQLEVRGEHPDGQ